MSSAYIRLAVIGASALSSQVFAGQETESDTPLLDKLKQTHDLSNPNRNHQNGGLYPGIESQMNRPSRDISAEIQSQLSTAGPSRTIDVSKRGSGKTQAEMLTESNNLGRSIGLKHGQPQLNATGGAKGEYARKGTREFYRDENGELKTRVVEGVQKVGNLGSEDLYSSEKDNSQYDFRAHEMHGQDEKIKQDGFRNHQSLKSGSTGAARGYQAITGGAQRAINTGISEDEGWLQPSFNALTQVQTNNGEFFKNCESVTIKKDKDIHYTATTEHTCMDTGQAKFDRCEVEREVLTTHSVTNINQAVVGSCGPGCIDVTIGKKDDNVWSASCSIFSSSVTLDLNPNLNIDSVTVVDGVVDDHAVLKVNGKTAWSFINGIAGSSGELSSSTQCDLSKNFKVSHQGNILAALKEEQQKRIPILLKFDVKVGDKGEGQLRFKIQLSNPNGNGFIGKLTQYPEGCFDALKKEEKEAKPLTGYFASTSAEPFIYQCSKPADRKSCSTGEIIGTIGAEKCAVDAVTCPAGFSRETVWVNGSQVSRCTRAPDQVSSGQWSCSGPAGAGPYSFNASCSVSNDQFLDENNQLIKTKDSYGNSLAHRQFVDSALCSKTPPTSAPAPEKPASFCTFDNYKVVKAGAGNLPKNLLDWVPPFFEGDTGKISWRVNLEGYSCDPTDGQLMCRVDGITGEQTCVEWKDVQDQPARCETYIQDPECREIERTCPDGWREEISGRCMSEQVVFRCDRNKQVDYETTETTNVCAAAIPCAGGDDCINTEPESNDKFVQAMVAGNILDHMQTDAVCEDPADPSTCRVFEGEYKYCSWETTGLGTDCCEQPKGLDILAYVATAYQMAKLGQLAGTGAFGTTAQGSYNTLKEPITNAAGAVADWAAGAYKSATEAFIGNSTGTVATSAGTTTVGAGAGPSAIGAAMGELQQKAYKFVYDMMPPDLAGMLFQTAGEEGAQQLVLNEALTNALSNVMAAYTAYQTIKLAMTLLTACDDTELDMGIRLAQRSCFKVGDDYCAKKYPIIGTCMQQRQDYCCYGSILSRIIMKESYSQLGINPITADTEASCQGLTPEQLSQVDFGKPSMESALQEWIGLLADSGLMKSTADEMSLTGGAKTAEMSCQVIEKVDIDPASGLPKRDSKGNVLYVSTGEKECWDTVESGQIYNTEQRDPVGTRTSEMTEGADSRVQESKDRMRDATNNLDCSVTPRPPVCGYGFDPRTGGG